MFGSLPEVIGVYADPKYTHSHYFEKLFDMVPPGSVVALPVMNKYDVRIRNAALLRLTSDRIKEWSAEGIDELVLRRGHEELLADHMFLSYLRFFRAKATRGRSHLYIFPHVYDERDSVSYSPRIQSMIIKAHLLDIQYTIIKEGTLDDLFKSDTNNEGSI